jgi:hypothetical protein
MINGTTDRTIHTCVQQRRSGYFVLFDAKVLASINVSSHKIPYIRICDHLGSGKDVKAHSIIRLPDLE